LKKNLNQALTLILFSLAGMGGTWLLHPDPPSWNPMTVEEGEILLQDALAADEITWIDARSYDAFETEHIPGAILLNEDHWDEHFEQFIQVWDGVSKLVVYCDSRTCAASKGVADRLKEDLGFEDVLVLKGGWETWLNHQK
jgi:rhodanese-related sulfurtransferase